MRSLFFAAAACILSAAVPAYAESLLLSADKIYTAPDARPLTAGSVLMTDGRIAAVAELSRIAIPKGTRTSPCRGVLVAGFQNSHVHFIEKAFSNAATRPANDLERAVESMVTRFGFTTVFDTASHGPNTIALRRRIQNGELQGPRIFTVGIPLYPPDGFPAYLQDLPPDVLTREYQPRDADEARENVRGNLASGADGTKLFLHTSPRRGEKRLMSLDIARAAAAETHRQGKLVFAHPTSLEGIHLAIAAGVDVLVHTTLGEEKPWDASTLGKMIAGRMSVVPTFKLWKYELIKDQAPAPVIEMLIGKTQQELRDFRAAGGQVLFGTDVGYMHEYDPTEEYVYMSRAGMTPMEILESLTTAPAERLKEGARRGRIVAGTEADLVVLAGDPVEDIRNFAQVRCVFRAGKLIYASTSKH